MLKTFSYTCKYNVSYLAALCLYMQELFLEDPNIFWT